MKKILALVLVLAMMVVCLTGCKSDEQKAADDFIKEYKELLEDAEQAAEDMDADELLDIYNRLMEMAVEGEEIYQDLYDVDEDAAEEFQKEVEELSEEFAENMEEWY